MIKVAIVGNIASGKSTVEKFLQEKGFKVYDTDIIAHEILATSDDVQKEFGTFDRKKIAKIVFSDSSKLKILESIIHPKVKKELEKIFISNEKVIFISVPQLFEAGFDNLFDKIIYIIADARLRKERIINRNKLTAEEAQMRIDAQSEINKIEKSDFIIENNGTIEDLRLKVYEILNMILDINYNE